MNLSRGRLINVFPKKAPEKLSYFKTVRASDHTKDNTTPVIILYTATVNTEFKQWNSERSKDAAHFQIAKTTWDTMNQITPKA